MVTSQPSGRFRLLHRPLFFPLLLILCITASRIVAEEPSLDREALALASRLGLAASEIAFAIASPTGMLASHRADELMPPASVLKLVVAAGALDTLGPDFRFRTDLCASRRAAAGVLDGDLIVVGRGDPSISGRDHEGDALRLLRPWAASLRELGIRRVTGRLLGDDRYFAGTATHEDWPVEQLLRWYCAPSAALNLNDNCIDVVLTPRAGKGGGRIEVAIRPYLPLVTVENRIGITTEEKRHVFALERSPGSWNIRATGRFLLSAPERVEWVTVPDPSIAFLSALHAFLSEQGIEIAGGYARGDCPEDALIIEEIEQPLARLLPALLAQSQNLYGDCLLRTLGRESGGDGSFASGARAVEAFLEGVDRTASECIVRDGSGLSARNRLSASAVVAVLKYAANRPWRDVYFRSLAAPGAEGTLKHRFRGSPIAGALRAKTGHTAGVSSLAGVLTGAGCDVTFALFFHGEDSQVAAAREWQQQVLELTADRAAARER